MATAKPGVKRCPRTEAACIYLGCQNVKGICLIAAPDKGPKPFKRASKLEPSPSKVKPQVKGRKR